MVSVQRMLIAVSGLAVTFFVPTVVWITLIAGLFQLICKGIRRLGAVLPSPQRLARKSAH